MSRDNSLGRGGGMVHHGTVARLGGGSADQRYGGSGVESRYGASTGEGRHGAGTAEGNRSKTPPGTPKKGGKMMAIRVEMLDDSITLFQVQAKATGKILFDQVCKQLNLLETDYFGLEYQDSQGITYWLDRDKGMNQQVALPQPVDPILRFTVKFYSPDPTQLEEEYTRYLFSLQIKRDLATGQLQCNHNTAALMASYIVQAECGDFVGEDYPDHTYLSTYKFVPHQDSDLERRIMENHKKHVGQSPAEADLNLLETARRCELYGMRMHGAKDHEGVPLNLAVAHLGILVFQNYTKINTFSWAKIRKLSFKRKKFLIKLHPEGYGYYKDTVEFYFEDRNQCKNMWKKCVEHHGFFRCSEIIKRNREKTRIISRGSSFRYSGRTQKQIQEHVRENFVKRQSFQRHVRSLHGSLGNVGQSFSAQPLLPLTENEIAGTPASLSCGSSFSGVGEPSRLTDLDNLDLVSPYTGRRPSSHTAYVPEPSSPGQSVSSSPYRFMSRDQHHLPSYHHDPLYHQGQDVLGITTLQPNTQRRQRAAEALLRRNMPTELNTSIESTLTNSVSSRTGTTEIKTDQTVVPRCPSGDRSKISNRSQASLHSAQSIKSIEDGDSGGHLSSEDNLSHASYDLLDKEDEANYQFIFADSIKQGITKTELSYDNSVLFNQSSSKPHTPSRLENIEDDLSKAEERNCQSLREDLLNSNMNGKLKITNNHMGQHSSNHSSHQSVNSSAFSDSPLPEAKSQLLCEPVPILSRRRSSGSASQKSKTSKESKSGSHLSLKDNFDHDDQVEMTDDFHGHEIHMKGSIPSDHITFVSCRNKSKIGQNHNQRENIPSKKREESRDSEMHENIIFQSPANMKYFSSQIIHYNSRTLPGKRRREKSPVVFTRGKLSVDCSSGSSSSHASPRISRPKSLDFSVVALQDLPRVGSFSYRDDTIDQLHDFEDSSSALSVQNELNYASSSDVPQTPEMPPFPLPMGTQRQKMISNHNSIFSPKQNTSLYGGTQNFNHKEERIYDIPEGIEREAEVPEANSPISESSKTQTVLPKVDIDHSTFKTYLKIAGKMSSEDSESVSHQHHKKLFKVVPPVKVLKTVSSTESESIPSAPQSAPFPQQFDSDTLSLPLDLLSPPMESETSTALAESESLPAPPQFGSGTSRDDTDVEEDVTPKGDEITPDSLDFIEITPDSLDDNKNNPKESQNCQIQTNSTENSRKHSNDIGMLDEWCSYGDAILEAQDTIESFTSDVETQRRISTYEERVEALLESQNTIDSFTNEIVAENEDCDDEVFVVEPENNQNDIGWHPSSFKFDHQTKLLLDSQDTLDSPNEDGSVLKRQESTYEAVAEHILESQTTVDSFTSAITRQNSICIDSDPFLHRENTIESFLLDRKQEQIIYEEDNSLDATRVEPTNNQVPNKEIFFNKECGDADTDANQKVMMAEMYVRHLAPNESLSTNGESEDGVPFIDDIDFDNELIESFDELSCGTPDIDCANISFPRIQQVERVFLPPARSDSSSSFDPALPVDPNDEAPTPIPDLPAESCSVSHCAGIFDLIDPPPPLPPDDFANCYPIPADSIYFTESFHGPFPPRALSRISEKSSNESPTSPSETTPVILEDASEHNYTTSEDNENAPSISSDLPENMAAEIAQELNNPKDIPMEYLAAPSPPSSVEESLKYTEYTEIGNDSHPDDLDDTNADDIKTEEQEITVDLSNSMTSENDETNIESEGSLHDSMQILEDINDQDDHFESEERPRHEDIVHTEFCQIKLEEQVRKVGEGDAGEALSTSLDYSNSDRYVVQEGAHEVIL